MKAQVLHGYGAADDFTLESVQVPDPRSGEVRIVVRAIGINPMDVKIRSGSLKDQMPTDFPAILGSDVAGVVEKVGAGVDGLAEGDRVVGLSASGAYAEFAVARADHLAKIPDGLDFDRAATIPTAAETAGRVIKLLHPKAGETVVVNGAAGSVGSAAVQLLVRGGVTVIGTASEANHDYLRQLGATPTSYGHGVQGRIRGIASHGVDAVFDVTGQDFMDVAIALRGGTDRIVTISDFPAAQRGITVSYGVADQIRGTDFGYVLDLAAFGEFTTEIAETFRFEDLPAAHKFSETGHLRGKIVVTGPDAA